MAANRFDQPAQAQFINTYAPLPFKELYAATQQRRGVLDENLGRLDAARAAADQLKYIPGSQDETTIGNVRRTMDDIANNYLDKDLSDPEIYRSLRSDLRTKINTGDINDIQSSYGAWASNQKNVADLKKKGLYREEIDQDPGQGYNTLGEQGIYGHQTSSYVDARPIGEQYFNQLTPSSKLRRDPNTGLMAYFDVIDETTIADVATDNVQSFLDTQGGQQAVQIAKARGVEGDDEQIAQAILLDIGKEKITDRLRAFVPGQTRQEEEPEYAIPSSTTGPTITKAGISDRPGLRGRSDIKKAVPKVKDLIPGVSVSKRSFDETIEGFFNDETKEEQQELEFKTEEDEAQFNQYADAAKNYYDINNWSGLTAKDQIEKVEDYITFKYTQQRNPEVYEYTTEEVPEETKRFDAQMKLNPMFANRAVYDPTEPMTQELGTARDLLTEYPPEAGYTWTPIGRTSDLPRQELALAKQVEIRDEAGTPQGTFWIAGSDQERQKTAFDNKLTTELLYGDLPQGSFEMNFGTDTPSRIEWVVDEKQGRLPVYKARITHEDGSGINWVTSESIGDLKNQIFEQLRFFSQ